VLDRRLEDIKQQRERATGARQPKPLLKSW